MSSAIGCFIKATAFAKLMLGGALEMNQILNIEIGQRLRDQREHLQITREKLCEIVDVSPQFLSEVERGVKGLSVEKLLVICDGLGLSADYVLRGRENPTDISPIIAMLATLEDAYIPLAEDVLKAFYQASIMKKTG